MFTSGLWVAMSFKSVVKENAKVSAGGILWKYLDTFHVCVIDEPIKLNTKSSSLISVSDLAERSLANSSGNVALERPLCSPSK